MAKSTVQLFQSKPSGRLTLILSIAGVALVMFGIGYGVAHFRPGAETTSGTSQNAATPPSQAAPVKAGNLADLLPGLEAKVAANPNDVEQRVLLGQTYGELGQRDKAIKELRTAHRNAPQEARITILLATALMDGGPQSDLRESYKLLGEAVSRKPEVAPMARLYQGDILMKLGDNRGALKVWKEYLGKMPADDSRRTLFEDKIAQASAPR
ncbi:MAG: tetratricopeptide repeat protein [Bacteroidota bacterium]